MLFEPIALSISEKYDFTNPLLSDELLKAPFGNPSPKIALPANLKEEINSGKSFAFLKTAISEEPPPISIERLYPG